eukprot:gene20856-27691_t
MTTASEAEELANDFLTRPSAAARQLLLAWFVTLLNEEFVGNRIVGSTAWGVVKAMGKAYPLLLSPSIKQAEAAVDANDDATILQQPGF